MRNSATVKIVLDPQSKEQMKSIKLRVTFNRVWRVRAIPLDIKLTAEQFGNDNLKKTKEAKAEARKYLTIAETICKELGTSFTWIEFDLRYKKAVWDKEVVYEIEDWDDILQAYFIKYNSQQNTRDNYSQAVKWVKRYCPNATIADMTVEFVAGLKSFMKKTHKKKTKQEMSVNTIAIYFRALKAICNYAIEQKLITDNPFTETIETAVRQKRAVSSSDWTKFVSYKPEPNTKLEFAHDFALLSFALCGANMADILRLKNLNIVNNRVCFIRKKTERVDTNVSIPLSETAKSIMKKYGVLNINNPNAYIFPFYQGALTEKSMSHKRSDILKKVNGGISQICDILGIEHFTTYHIRHTFTVLSRDKKGFSAEQLMLLLGHKNIETTQIYLNSITDELMSDTSDFIDDMLR